MLGGGENGDENLNKEDVESKNYLNLETNKNLKCLGLASNMKRYGKK